MTNKHALVLAATLIATATPAAATVTFDFYATATIGDCVNGISPCHQLNAPLDLFRLTLSSGTETGSAIFFYQSGQPANVTDPNFRFAFVAPSAGPNAVEAPYNQYGLDYILRWSAVAGQLTDVALQFDGPTETSVDFTNLNTGTEIGAIGVCAFTQICRVTGFWTDPPPNPIPEPGSMVLLLGALLSFGVRPLVAKCAASIIPPPPPIPADPPAS